MVMTKSLWLIGDFSRKKTGGCFRDFGENCWFNSISSPVVLEKLKSQHVVLFDEEPDEIQKKLQSFGFVSTKQKWRLKRHSRFGIWWKTNFLERFWFPDIWTVDFIKFNHSIFNKDQNWTRTRNFRNGSQQESWCKTKTFWKSLAVRESPIETWKFLTFSAFTVV